ncbi:hypothetical protein JCGZ_10366 [Jatropha curcas]|uniref:Uncharacterized protein n=1 Tax=Jatropha curcas TaxID=180498 RepID=A0A067KGY9_JATCU|nr:hypothetical protein JCGZ_06468 [Jatropha curcas]KDP35382.1 hypothetical protein JCGZ_10366 [Jatropha curcas]
MEDQRRSQAMIAHPLACCASRKGKRARYRNFAVNETKLESTEESCSRRKIEE